MLRLSPLVLLAACGRNAPAPDPAEPTPAVEAPDEGTAEAPPEEPAEAIAEQVEVARNQVALGVTAKEVQFLLVV